MHNKAKNQETKIEYSLKQIKKLTDDGAIPTRIGELFIEYMENQEKRRQRWDKRLKSGESLEQIVNTDPPVLFDIDKEWELHELLVNNKGLLNGSTVPSVASKEFLIRRAWADPVSKLIEMLGSLGEISREGDGEYSMSSAVIDDTYSLSIDFDARNMEEALKVKEIIKNGIRIDVLLAPWYMASKKGTTEFTCKLTDLMRIVYPDTTYKFSSSQRAAFYQKLNRAKRIIMNVKRKTARGEAIYAFPLVTVKDREYITTKDKNAKNYYPTYVTIEVFKYADKMNSSILNLWMSITNNIFKLPLKDQYLAFYIAVRSHQMMEKTQIKISRERIIELACLGGFSKSGMQNKKLKEKLERVKKAGLIDEYPKKITDLLILNLPPSKKNPKKES